MATILAAGAAAAAPVDLAADIQTQAMYNQLLFAPYVQLQDPQGPFTSGSARSYVEHRNSFSNARDAMGSAVGDTVGNLQVGAEVGPSAMGTANAWSWLRMGYTNHSPEPQRITLIFHILPGEVLIKDVNSFGLPIHEGLFNGGISYYLDVTDTMGETRNVYDVGFSLHNIDGVWEMGDETTSFGIGLVDQLYDGGDQYGVTMQPTFLQVQRDLDIGDYIGIDLIMSAWATKNIGDWTGVMSAKVGDPTNPNLRSSFTVDVVPLTAAPVPEPGSAWLVGLAMVGLWATRVRPPQARPAA